MHVLLLSAAAMGRAHKTFQFAAKGPLRLEFNGAGRSVTIKVSCSLAHTAMRWRPGVKYASESCEIADGYLWERHAGAPGCKRP